MTRHFDGIADCNNDGLMGTFIGFANCRAFAYPSATPTNRRGSFMQETRAGPPSVDQICSGKVQVKCVNFRYSLQPNAPVTLRKHSISGIPSHVANVGVASSNLVSCSMFTECPRSVRSRAFWCADLIGPLGAIMQPRRDGRASAARSIHRLAVVSESSGATGSLSEHQYPCASGSDRSRVSGSRTVRREVSLAGLSAPPAQVTMSAVGPCCRGTCELPSRFNTPETAKYGIHRRLSGSRRRIHRLCRGSSRGQHTSSNNRGSPQKSPRSC